MKVAVLISGRGSNLRSLLEVAAQPGYPAEIVTVIANRPGAGGLDHAAAFGVSHQTIDHKDFPDRTAFETALTAALKAAGAEMICLAGFMRVLSSGFVRQWQDRIINIHPSLLPLFPGLDTHARALAAGVKLHGCSVHFVNEAVDGGAIIGQAAVPVLGGDDPDKLAARVLKAEHRLYPYCLRLLAEGRIRLIAGRVAIEADPDPGHSLLNPAPPA
ncbi:phosphoribosylglycinamide formyltransferase [Pelagibius litoralis]|uniref:Phosphoribosylglycinamide formyltransferase n=1 Tax=Pelagibius litoralis TaxID=374515 RepID=A0A967EZG7_9PROT|nr:phosphoribosylglycinamide formyltransferase [Pelagibius litoralis]NIA70282.1 phosphoribosylglycinamide formyltransferase [Pelagibius litoralis]